MPGAAVKPLSRPAFRFYSLFPQHFAQGKHCIADTLRAGAQHRTGLDAFQVFADGGTTFFFECLHQLFGNAGRPSAVRGDARHHHGTDQCPASAFHTAHAGGIARGQFHQGVGIHRKLMLSGETCTQSVAAAIESGYRMINTAEAYGNEKEVGAGIKASGMDRKKLFLVTKVNFKSYENAEQTVLQSLENLQTDYIDLLLLHWPFANYYAAWRSLEKLYTEGKVRAIGVSNFEPDQLLDLIAYNKVVPAVNQIKTNLYCQRTAERGWMDKSRVAHMAYAPLGQGNRSEMFKEPAVLALAEKYGKTPAQIQLRFLTQKGIAVIPRSTQPAHIRENFALFDFALTAEEMARLSALDKKEPLIGKPETPELVEFSLTW